MSTNPLRDVLLDGSVTNNSGGPAFLVDGRTRARRFLVSGSESTFYQSGQQLSEENAAVILSLANTDARWLVDEIVAVSTEGRAAKQDYALFALAIVAALAEDEENRGYAFKAVGKVARTLSTLTLWVSYFAQFRGRPSGRGYHRAVATWMERRDADGLAFQAAKYRQRNGWTLGDLARVSHPSPHRAAGNMDAWDAVISWSKDRTAISEATPSILRAFEAAQASTDADELVALIDGEHLAWEMVPDAWLNEPNVLRALGRSMPLTATLRQLTRFTRAGLFTEHRYDERGEDFLALIVDRLTDDEQVSGSRLHPMTVLTGLLSYRAVDGASRRILDALDQTFRLTVQTVEPSGLRQMVALDVSYSMNTPVNAGTSRPGPGQITARQASVAMSLITLASEPNSRAVAFTSGGGWGSPTKLTPLDYDGTESLEQVIQETDALPFGATDISLPIRFAEEQRIPVDVFTVYTDNETNRSTEPVADALRRYRQVSGIDARLVVVALTATEFSVADPNDPLMLDLAGLDSASPKIISEFAAGRV